MRTNGHLAVTSAAALLVFLVLIHILTTLMAATQAVGA